MNTTPIYKTPAGEQAVMALYDAALERWPVPCQQMTILTRHGETFVIACGDESAPPLVLLHGAGTNSAIWAPDTVEYTRRYRVYAADLPGEPGKSTPNRPAWDGPAYAEWLADVFDALKIERAALLGVSQGGWTALRFAVRWPERVEKLVLMTPGGVIQTRSTFLPFAMLCMLLGRWGLKQMTRRLFADQTIPAGVEEIMVTISSHFKPRVGVLPVYTDEELRRLTMPTCLIGGDKDIVIAVPQVAERLQALLPCLSVTILPGAGHALLNTSGHVMAFLAGEGQ